MKAVVIDTHGGTEVLRFEDRPEPQPAPGQVRVRLSACGLNHLDVWVRRGVPGHTFPLPIVPGCDGAGVVDAVGAGVKSPRVGDRVLLSPGQGCGACMPCSAGQDQLCRDYQLLGETRDGTCAEQVVVPAATALAMPAELSFETAAAFPLVYLTAWNMLVSRAGVRPGSRVLVHAAGSGVSTAAIQIANLFGAEVFATAGSAEKCERALKLGASAAWNYSSDDWAKAIRAATGRRGPDIVVDHVGSATFATSVAVLSKGGVVVTCGATSGPEVTLDLRRVFFKSISILGSTMGSRGELHRIVELVARGRLAPVVDRVMPLMQVRLAHELLESRKTFGKIVLTP